MYVFIFTLLYYTHFFILFFFFSITLNLFLDKADQASFFFFGASGEARRVFGKVIIK